MDARPPKDRLTEGAVAALVTQTPEVERYADKALRAEMEYKRARLRRDLARAERDPRGSPPETIIALVEPARKAESCLPDLETALNMLAAARAVVAALRAEGIALRLEVTLLTRHTDGARYAGAQAQRMDVVSLRLSSRNARGRRRRRGPRRLRLGVGRIPSAASCVRRLLATQIVVASTGSAARAVHGGTSLERRFQARA